MAATSFTFGHVFATENKGKIDDFYIIEKKAVGEGSYGQVFKGKAKSTGETHAIKQIEAKKIKDPKKFEIENEIQRSLDHPNIAKLYEVYRDAKYYYLVMELCTGGEIFDHIIDAAESSGVEGHAFTEAIASKYMTQIMGAITYMHSNGYVHRDIKPENFLMQNKTKEAEIKVIDFGLAKNNSDGKEMTTKAGTPYYVAPQVLAGKYDEKCDVWSCGVIAYILLCGYPPFYGEKDNEILKMVKKGEFDFPSPDWDDRSPESKDLITKMLTLNPTKRPSAAEVLQMKWLQSAFANEKTVILNNSAFASLKSFHSASRLKKMALTMIAQEMKASDIEELKTVFKSLDKNHDGTLNHEEILQAIADVKSKGSYSFTPEDLERYLLKLDTDGSGKIDWSEFLAAMMSKQNVENETTLWKAFRRFDLDGDGQITKAELKTILTQNEEKDLAEDAIAKAVEDLMKDGDTDGDAQISFEEFKAMMKKAE